MAVRQASPRILLSAVVLLVAVLAARTLPTPFAAPAADVRSTKAEVEFRLVDNVGLRRGHAVRATFADSRHTRTLAGGDFTTVQEGHLTAGPFETATTGELTITGTLVDEEGTALGQATLSLPLEPDRRYGVWIVVGSGDPTAGCMGCAGSRSFPLAPVAGCAPGVALAVVWGSNSISNPVVY